MGITEVGGCVYTCAIGLQAWTQYQVHSLTALFDPLSNPTSVRGLSCIPSPAHKRC